jgi:hypothetical protein
MSGDAPPPDAAARAEALLAAAEAAAQAAAAARAQAMATLEGAPAAAPSPPAPGAATPATPTASGAPGRDPTSPARLLALAEELAARTHDARHQLDALADAVERTLAGPGAATGAEGAGPSRGRPGPTAEDLRAATARLVAVEMALAGATRGEVSDVLARAFGTADDRLLDEVLGEAPPSGAAPRGG